MTLSNALPVQFWSDPDESFNNKVVCGIESVCWCQPWNCDDEINLQFVSYVVADYSLNVLDSEDTVLETIPFDQVASDPTDYLAGYPLTGFTNESGAGADWTTGATPSVTGSSDYLAETISGIIAGTYQVSIGLNVSAAGGTVTVGFYKDGSLLIQGSTTYLTSGSKTMTKTLTLSEAPDTVKINFDPGPFSNTLTVSSITMTLVSFYNYLSFVPSDYCNQQIKLQIISDEVTPDTATSDCLSIKTNHTCTELITYSNSRDFAGLLYTDQSPEQIFYIRLPAVFFEDDHNTEQEDSELSNGTIVRRYNKLEKKKLLDLSFIPPYMHEKLQLILMHDNITISDREWIRRDAYTKTEGNKRYPLKRASVWLHDKNFITENQL